MTVNGVATLSIAKLTADPSFEERMFRLFTEMGIQLKLSGSELYGF